MASTQYVTKCSKCNEPFKFTDDDKIFVGPVQKAPGCETGKWVVKCPLCGARNKVNQKKDKP